jgi:lipoprotein-anchoring transpeptidase ErfK/SrfK
MRRIAVIASLVSALGLLSACGFNGTDPDPAGEEASAPQAAAEDPDLAAFEETAIADPEPRPLMQLQVVLDAQGFAPGVIDGGMGMSTRNALRGFQETSGLEPTGELDQATREALAQWQKVPATRVVRIPESWGRVAYRVVPDEPEAQARMEALGYASLDEKLAERFHTTVEVLQQLNPGGRPSGSNGSGGSGGSGAEPGAAVTGTASAAPAAGGTGSPEAEATAGSSSVVEPAAVFRPGQLVRVPNVGFDIASGTAADDEGWARTLAALGVGADQPAAARIVVDKSEGTLRAFDDADKLIALFTVTTGSQHDPLPLGEWKVLGVAHNPPFHYNPDLFWDAEADDEKARLPPGPNGPVGVVWIDLNKEHYGIHGTPEPHTIGRTQSHGCVRLTNWDAARLAGMVSGSTTVLFEA